ncbi:GIY-YIG nuclease family protein [Mucilaginibacter sp. ZT4R22]|uniref:GIY-YIG nuclease family protein n=1 Tax=Mucilaginibacter pankratovii TaxID=2772110 RepID=A0ABR7WUZ4_9SPHI|nr:GIY-YIG nuclease family protein [Mucilaginibacter pankratovii]MBD1365362.1 GIY-YIG nuclease family protein [Mucilaginibacter pankratovii]
MTPKSNTDDKFYSSCFRLSEADILKFDEQDNGPINNVLAGIAYSCYGVRLYDDQHGVSADMFFINGRGKLKGDIITLNIQDPDYYELLLRFCILLSEDYQDVDAIGAFNTFQQKLRGFLEKKRFTTVTSPELRKFRGQDAVLMSAAPRGIIKIDLIDPVEFYRDFFNNIVNAPIDKSKDYVYLMVNTQTSLIKIGTSNNPVYRERTLHSQEPTVHLIAYWCCGKDVEKNLHAKYAGRRVRGEWFRLGIRELTEIEKFMMA